MEQFRAPSPLDLTANLADNWCSWEQSFRRYIAASGEKDEQRKLDILLHTIGEDALAVFNTLSVRGKGHELTMEDVLLAFKDHCCPQRNVVYERLQYWSHQRTAGTSVNTFITELKQKSKDCEFGIIENDMLRDKLMLSITDSHLKKRLLQERRLTLHTAIEICRAIEQENTLLQAVKTEHGMQEVPVVGEIKIILPDESLHHDTSRHLSSQSVSNTIETVKLVLAAFRPKVQLHRFQLQQPSDTDCVFSERTNEEQRLHIKEDPEMLSEGQEEYQICVQQETNNAACAVKCEDEEEEPQASQVYWRQLTEMSMEEEPSPCSLNEFNERQSMGINGEGPEAAQNPVPSSLLQGPDGTETDLSQTEDNNKDDEDKAHWQNPLSESDPERVGEKKATPSAASKLQMNSGVKPFQCDVCSECFIRKQHLKSHMRIHTGEKPFKCDFCSKCFILKQPLQLHMRIHTGEKPFKCDVCSKCFIRKQQLKLHMSIHTGEKPFKCDVCSKCFIQKCDLNKHMRIHTGDKPFKCDVCSKCFIHKSDLNDHMTIHTGDKPFKCDFCSKCFIRKQQLLLHIRIHTGEKPFKCDFCSKCFIRKQQLLLHIRIHTGETPFKCDVCNKSFTRKASLQSHERMHKEEEPFKCDV